MSRTSWLRPSSPSRCSTASSRAPAGSCRCAEPLFDHRHQPGLGRPLPRLGVTDEGLAHKYFEYVDGLQALAEAAAVIDFISRLHEAEDLRDLERLLR